MKFARVGAWPLRLRPSWSPPAAAPAAARRQDPQARHHAPAVRWGRARRAPARPLKGAQLAVDEVNAKGGVDGYKIAPVAARPCRQRQVQRPQQGAKDMQTLVADPAVIGVVGPFNSAVAKVQIPISQRGRPAPVPPGEHQPGPHQG